MQSRLGGGRLWAIAGWEESRICRETGGPKKAPGGQKGPERASRIPRVPPEKTIHLRNEKTGSRPLRRISCLFFCIRSYSRHLGHTPEKRQKKTAGIACEKKQPDKHKLYQKI